MSDPIKPLELDGAIVEEPETVTGAAVAGQQTKGKPADAKDAKAAAEAAEKERKERAALIEAQALHAARLNLQRLAQRDPAVRSLLAERDEQGRRAVELFDEVKRLQQETAKLTAAGETSAKRVTELEAENARQLAELKAAAEQIKELQKQVKAAAKKPAPDAGA